MTKLTAVLGLTALTAALASAQAPMGIGALTHGNWGDRSPASALATAATAPAPAVGSQPDSFIATTSGTAITHCPITGQAALEGQGCPMQHRQAASAAVCPVGQGAAMVCPTTGQTCSVGRPCPPGHPCCANGVCAAAGGQPCVNSCAPSAGQTPGGGAACSSAGACTSANACSTAAACPTGAVCAPGQACRQ